MAKANCPLQPIPTAQNHLSGAKKIPGENFETHPDWFLYSDGKSLETNFVPIILPDVVDYDPGSIEGLSQLHQMINAIIIGVISFDSYKSCLGCKARVESTSLPLGQCMKCCIMLQMDKCGDQLMAKFLAQSTRLGKKGQKGKGKEVMLFVTYSGWNFMYNEGWG